MTISNNFRTENYRWEYCPKIGDKVKLSDIAINYWSELFDSKYKYKVGRIVQEADVATNNSIVERHFKVQWDDGIEQIYPASFYTPFNFEE